MDLSTLQVKTTDLNEVDVTRIQIGDIVDLSFDALPDTTVTGKVSEISLKNTSGSGVYYDVFIKLDEIPQQTPLGDEFLRGDLGFKVNRYANKGLSKKKLGSPLQINKEGI